MSLKNKNTDKIVEMAKLKTDEAKQKVLDTLEELLSKGEKITFYKVFTKAGVSKSFVYQNEEIRAIVEQYRKKPVKKIQTQDSKDVIINALKEKMKELEKENKKLQKDAEYKDKYEKVEEENKQLKVQLEKLYAQLY